MTPDQGNGACGPHPDYGLTALVLQGGGAAPVKAEAQWIRGELR
jgi:hypothetical protein